MATLTFPKEQKNFNWAPILALSPLPIFLFVVMVSVALVASMQASRITSVGNQTWTVEVSADKHGSDYLYGFRAKGIRLDGLAERQLSFIRSETAQKVTLVALTPRDLGLKDHKYTTGEIFEAAHKKGYGRCSYEMVPQLRLQYENQPRGERLVIAGEADNFLTYGSCRNAFSLEHDEKGLWLKTISCEFNDFWDPNQKFAFVKP